MGERGALEFTEMKTVACAIQKGGVGKTSTSVHLAFNFVERGLRVAMIDLDTQGNASQTLKEYACGVSSSALFDSVSLTDIEATGLVLFEADAKLATLEKMSTQDAVRAFRRSLVTLKTRGFDVCVIDTPPALGVAMVAALASSSHVVSPVEMEIYSIQGIKKMLQTLANVRQVNPNLSFIGMFASKVDSRNPRHVAHLTELRAAYPDLLLPTSIGLRSSIADALARGIPVWQVQKTTAREASRELRALSDHIAHAMEIDR